MCLVLRLEALQCAVQESMSMAKSAPEVLVVVEENHTARCPACLARAETKAEAGAAAPSACACGCACSEDACACGELLVSISGAYGVMDFCVPLAQACELGLPLGRYKLTVRGGGDTHVLGVKPDDSPMQAAADGCARCSVTEKQREVGVELASGCRIRFDLNAVLCDDTAQAIHHVAPYLNQFEAAAAAGLGLGDEGRRPQGAKPLRPTRGVDVSGELAALGRKLECTQKAAESTHALCQDIAANARDFVGLMAPADCVTTHALQVTTGDKAAAVREAMQTLETAASGALAHARAVETAAVDLEAMHALLPEAEAARVLRLARLRGEVLRALAPGPGVSPLPAAAPASTESGEMVSSQAREWAGARVSTAVDRRSFYIALSAVDAALRTRTACVEGAEKAAARDAKMCAYQLRQVMATDAHNDVKLSASVFERCLTIAAEAQQLAAAPLEPGACLASAAPAVRALRAAKVLEAVEAGCAGCPVAPAANYMYQLQGVQAGRHAEAASGAAQEARTVLAAMADADLQHRVISPLVHKCVRQACARAAGLPATPGEAKTTVPAEDVEAAFAPDVRPLARLALCGEAPGTSEDPYAFLDDASVRTGYDEGHKTRLLVRLMFGSGA